MPDGYGTHADYMAWVKEDAEKRLSTVEAALRKAFSGFIEKREVDVIVFSGMTAFDLAAAIVGYPLILKPLLAACNIAARAIERDLSIRNVIIAHESMEIRQASLQATSNRFFRHIWRFHV